MKNVLQLLSAIFDWDKVLYSHALSQPDIAVQGTLRNTGWFSAGSLYWIIIIPNIRRFPGIRYLKMHGFFGKIEIIKRDDLGVPLFQETSIWRFSPIS